MGIGDSIGKAAENAMEDLAGTSSPTENARVPEPTDPNSDVEVHSSISEGSSAMAAEKESDAGDVPRDVPGPAGLPDGDPDALRADPGEGDEDPSTDLGRS